MPIRVRRAALEDVDQLAPLMDAYRMFYRQPSDPERAKLFLTDRLQRNESVVFLAMDDTRAIGFTQLYPSFSSGALAPIFILNDLFVSEDARGQGAGAALIHAAVDHARAENAVRLVLSTQLTNTVAQSLYERLGWKRDTEFCVYQLSVNSRAGA